MESNTATSRKRPLVLSVFLVLTFIRVGLMLTMLLLLTFTRTYLEYTIEQYPEELDLLARMIRNPGYIWTNFFAELIILMGAWMMWKLSRKGFYIYMLGKLMALTSSYIFGVESLVLTPGFFFTFLVWAVWPVIYSIHLRKMN